MWRHVVRSLGFGAARRAFDRDHPETHDLAKLQMDRLAIAATRSSIQFVEILPYRSGWSAGAVSLTHASAECLNPSTAVVEVVAAVRPFPLR